MSENPIQRARDEGRTTLTEPESKELLADAGIETPASVVVSSSDAAADAAAEIGFPVVLKVSSAAVTHKSEWADGLGVTVGIDSAEAAAETAAAIFDAAEERGIEADVLVEETADIDRGTEVIVGGMRDASFGPVVLTGLGGIFTELFGDTAHRVAPIDAAEAREAIEELTAVDLLEGYRGRPAADVDALAEVVSCVGDLVVEHEAIAEIDVNPVLATADGATALDAMVVVDGDSEEA